MKRSAELPPLPDDPDAVILTLPVAPVRRWLGILMTGALGVILIRTGVAIPLGRSFWGLGLIAGGGVLLWLALAMWRATAAGLELTSRELREEGGRTVARIADVARVERGTFVPKPSQGFLLRLAAPGGRAWAPGVWWRIGRHVGVGGVTSARAGKDMAAFIEHLISRCEDRPASPRS